MHCSRFFLHRLPLLALALALTSAALQAGAKFQGNVGYQISTDGLSVTLKADGIQNTSASDATGTLLMRLWASDAPYQGNNQNGTLLGTYKLSGLQPGNHYPSLNQTVPLTRPGVKKNYVICLMLSEFQKGNYVTVDWRNMPNPLTLGPLPLFEMSGPWKWQSSYEGGTIDLSLGKISHHRNSKTGSLRLSVWAFPQPYGGSSQNGYELGRVEKAALEKGYNYPNLQHVVKFTPPPDGSYWVSLILSEYQNNGYTVVAYLNSNSASTFKKP